MRYRHIKPKSGHPYSTPLHDVWLGDDAQGALRLFCAMLADRTAAATGDTKHVSSINQAGLAELLEQERGSMLGHLLHLAMVHAEAHPLPWAKPLHQQTRDEQMIRPSDAKWDMAVTLANEERAAQHAAEPPTPTTPGDDTCRHGVPYRDICAACDAEA